MAPRKIVAAVCLCASARAFQLGAGGRPSRVVVRGAPDIRTDVGSGWTPEQGGMESTDTPDFFYEDGDERNSDIEYTDGIMGSTGLDKLKGMNSGGDPGVAGALDVDPTRIGGYVSASAEAAGVKFELDTLAKMGRFEQEVVIEMPAASDAPRAETVFIKPVCMAYEDFYAGWAPESTPGVFSVSPVDGRMDRRGGAPTELEIEIKPDGQTGEKVGYMVMVLPEENEQFTVKVTVKCF